MGEKNSDQRMKINLYKAVLQISTNWGVRLKPKKQSPELFLLPSPQRVSVWLLGRCPGVGSMASPGYISVPSSNHLMLLKAQLSKSMHSRYQSTDSLQYSYIFLLKNVIILKFPSGLFKSFNTPIHPLINILSSHAFICGCVHSVSV